MIKTGKVRATRLGEIPTHYAMEDIKEGEGLIADHMPIHIPKELELGTVFPIQAFRFEIRDYRCWGLNQAAKERMAEVIKRQHEERRIDRAWSFIVGFVCTLAVLYFGAHLIAFLTSH